MDDLTSKSELIRDLEKECDSIIITPYTASYELRALKSALRMAIKRIEKAPAVDAVPVVRCKDCKYYNQFLILRECTKDYSLSNVSPDDYCSRGERKEDG